jgi:hydroxyacylglutathione hydrolase
LTPSEVLAWQHKGAQVLDLRNDQALAAAFIPRAFGIPLDMVSSFGGWFLEYDRPVVLVLDREADREKALQLLARIGYDNVVGFLGQGLAAWTVAALPVEAIGGIDVHRLHELLTSRSSDVVLLDVRSKDEFEEGYIGTARHIYVGEIEKKAHELPSCPIITYCATGKRALVAAAVLKHLGRSPVTVCWGSMNAWKRAGFAVTRTR